MYLQKTYSDAVHGVDYTKGIPPGHFCGRVHKYQTRGCRPVLFAAWERAGDRKDYVDYNSLSDKEILALGEPVFLSSTQNKGETKVENCKCSAC